MKVLIDTNVVLDAMASRAPYNTSAETIFLLAAEGKVTAAVTATSVTDIHYLLRKHSHDADQAKQAIARLLDLFEIMDVTEGDCRRALAMQMRDYEDAVLAATAKRN